MVNSAKKTRLLGDVRRTPSQQLNEMIVANTKTNETGNIQEFRIANSRVPS